jgi:hypothetical protein
MTHVHPRPELWTRAAALVLALRRLLGGCAPDAFASIAAEARLRLSVAAALVRRYIHVLAAEMVLAPLRPARPVPDRPARPRLWRAPLFALTEEVRSARTRLPARTPDPPALQWALIAEAVSRLGAVLADPQPHARRLARRLRRGKGASLRDLPVPAPVLRRLAPETDALLCRFDRAARPSVWATIDTS